MNSINLIGRLTRDPELKKTQSGKSITRFTLAVDKRIKQEGNPTADFFDCIAWERRAETIANYVRKGNQLGITGRMESRTYEIEGTNRKVWEVIVDEITFTSKNDNQTTTNYSTPEIPESSQEATPTISDDMLPF